jgi:hypothetical protein
VDLLVERRGFEPMAIAGAVRVGSPHSRPPSAEDLLFAGPPLDIGEEERTFVVTSA